MATTNSESFAQRKHIALATQKMFDLVKKWGVTPFDDFERVTNPAAGGSTTIKGDDDKIVFDSVASAFYLKKTVNSIVTYYQNWNTAGLYYNQSALRRDRCFVSSKGYVINGVKYSPDTKSLEEQIDSLWKDIWGNEEGETQAEKDGLFSRVGDLESDNTTNKSDISTLKGRVNGHDTDIAGLVANVAMHGATYFDKIVKGVISEVESGTGTYEEGDKIVYNDVRGNFLLMKSDEAVEISLLSDEEVEDGETEESQDSVIYFANWNTANDYNASSSARVDRFFVSPDGYVIFGHLFNPDLSDYVTKETYLSKVSDIEGDIDNLETIVGKNGTSGLRGRVSDLEFAKTTIEGNITSLTNTKASKDELNTLAAKLGVEVHAFANFISGTIMSATTTMNATPEQIYFHKGSNPTFVAKINGEYFHTWKGSSHYNDYNEDGSSSVKSKGLFASQYGYVVLGKAFEADLSTVVSKTELQNYQQSVTSSLAGKVDKSAYDTKMSQLDTAIAQRATTAQLATVVQNVNAKANQSDLNTLSGRVDNCVTTAMFDSTNDVIAKSLTDLEDKLAMKLQREFPTNNVLPTTNPDPTKIYMIKVSDTEGDYYNEYMWVTANNRYELLGNNRVQLGAYQTDADMKRYIAANQGLEFVIANGESERQDIILKQNDKIKAICMSGSITSVNVSTPSILDPEEDESVVSNLAIGDEFTITGVIPLKKISISTTERGANGVIRLFITNSNYSFNLMTDDDIDQIFNSLT